MSKLNQAEAGAIIDNTRDSPRDIAFSSWLSDIEDFLKATFGAHADPVAKHQIAALINHDETKGWGSDPNDKYGHGGAEYSQPEGTFLGLGPYWRRVRAIGNVLAKAGHFRAMGTLRYGTPAAHRSKPDPAAFEAMRAKVKDHVATLPGRIGTKERGSHAQPSAGYGLDREGLESPANGSAG